MRFDLRKKKQIRVRPYEKLSQIYDHVMRHVDYKKWGLYIHDLLRFWHPEPRRVLDVGCGTGNLLKVLAKSEFSLFGCDSSIQMLQIAIKKRGLQDVRLWCSGMLDFSLRSNVDIILCLYDSVNYILDPIQLAGFINTSANALSQDGLLIFDVCTERNSMKYFLNYHDHSNHALFSYDRWSHYDRDEKIQYTDFKIHFKSDDNVYLETHKQRIYSVRKLVNMIRETSLELVEVYDGFTFNPATSRSNRLHFVLRNKVS